MLADGAATGATRVRPSASPSSPGPALNRRLADCDVLELATFPHGAQEQRAAAHVAQAEELAREAQAFAAHRSQYLEVLLRRHAAEQHHFRGCVQSRHHALRVAFQWAAIAALADVDRHARIP